MELWFVLLKFHGIPWLPNYTLGVVECDFISTEGPVSLKKDFDNYLDE